MNGAKVVCRELNSLVFSESPVLTADQSVLDTLANNSFLKNLPNQSEYILALGGGSLKLRYDGDIQIDFVKANNFIPLSGDNNRITEASFISRIVRENKKYSLVETHKKQGTGYEITNTMYDDVTGRKVSLPDGMEETTTVNVTSPLFTYIKPNIANNFDPESPLGISLFANAVDTLKALDIAFDGLNSEMVLGKKRIIVPSNAIRSVVDENGKLVKYFDPSDEVFSALNIDDEESLKIQDNSVDLRIKEIKTAIQTLLDILAMQVGFSAGYLAFDGGGMKTATEVISDNSKTFKTKQSYENNLGEGIVDIMDSIRELMQAYNLGTVTNDEYSVTFSDSVIEDRNSKATYWINLYASGLVTLEVALQNIHGVSEEDAKVMAATIKSENQSVDPFPSGV